MLPSARGLSLHACGPLLFRLLHGLFGAAAAVEEQQIPRVLVKIALAYNISWFPRLVIDDLPTAVNPYRDIFAVHQTT